MGFRLMHCLIRTAMGASLRFYLYFTFGKRLHVTFGINKQ